MPDNNDRNDDDADGNMYLFLVFLAIAVIGFIAAARWLA